MFNPLPSLFNSLFPFRIGAPRWRILEKNYDKPLSMQIQILSPFHTLLEIHALLGLMKPSAIRTHISPKLSEQ